MKRPLAWYHLARLYELVTSSSICRVVVERQLFHSHEIEQAAAADLATAEEILTLARERGWKLPETKPYEWSLMTGEVVALPRIMRVLHRDVFELEEAYRECDDEAVASLLAEVRDARHALLGVLELKVPSFTLPGAK